MDRLTVAKDWPRLKQWAEELCLAEDCVAAAHAEVLWTDSAERIAHDRAETARAKRQEAQEALCDARHAFDSVPREMTRSSLNDEPLTITDNRER